MKKPLKSAVVTSFLGLLLMTGCSTQTPQEEAPPMLLCTTTMLADLAQEIAGDTIEIQSLMTTGSDPHLYEASAGDLILLENAQGVFYHGLHLEGKMADILEKMESQGKVVFSLEEAIPSEYLLETQDNSYDPHIWFDPQLWGMSAQYLTQALSQWNPKEASYYEENLQGFLEELLDLDLYIRQEIEKIPENSRVLVTAHDAFGYFAQRYGFQVEGIQGIATNTEASAKDIHDIATIIATQEIKSIFVESTVSPKNMEALQEAVAAQGFSVEIGGTLHSDSLGDIEKGEHTYVGCYLANIRTIIQGLTPSQEEVLP